MQRSSLGLAVFGFASCMAVAPLAMAQPAPKDDHHPAPPPHAVAHAPAPVVHHTNKVVDVHKNVHVNEHVNKTVVTHQVAGRPIVHAGGPVHAARWARGARFDGPRVAYSDWGRYHLRPPPPGYEWVQDDDELVLINLGTGIIDDTFVITLP